MQKNNQVMISIIEASVERAEAAQSRGVSMVGIGLGIGLFLLGVGMTLQIIGVLLVLAGILGAITQAVQEKNLKKTIENLTQKLE